MNRDVAPQLEGREASAKSERARRIDSAAWAAFFIWIGASALAAVGLGWFLAGLAIIVLGTQMALKMAGEKVDWFWLACGAVFLGASAWQVLGLEWPLAPILVILLGVGLLWRTFFGKPGQKP